VLEVVFQKNFIRASPRIVALLAVSATPQCEKTRSDGVEAPVEQQQQFVETGIYCLSIIQEDYL
jgi:hypothetical protein